MEGERKMRVVDSCWNQKGILGNFLLALYIFTHEYGEVQVTFPRSPHLVADPGLVTFWPGALSSVLREFGLRRAARRSRWRFY